MPPRFTVVVIAHDTLDRLVMSFLFLAHGAVILLLIAVAAQARLPADDAGFAGGAVAAIIPNPITAAMAAVK